MIIWRQELDRYLNVRRGLGYDLRTAERILRRFIAFSEARNASHLTVSLFLQWLETVGQIRQHTKAGSLRA